MSIVAERRKLIDAIDAEVLHLVEERWLQVRAIAREKRTPRHRALRRRGLGVPDVDLERERDIRERLLSLRRSAVLASDDVESLVSFLLASCRGALRSDRCILVEKSSCAL